TLIERDTAGMVDRPNLAKAGSSDITREQWLELVAHSGDKAGPDRRTVPGGNPSPSGARAHSAEQSPGPRWAVVQRIDDPDPGRANIQAKDDLEQGATGLS